MTAFTLYRYTHPDGTAKEWGYGDLGNGTAEIRWGRRNHLRQSQVRPLHEALERAAEKTRKGYTAVGTAWLDAQGARVPGRRPADPSLHARPRQSSI
jgi:4-alpha-glucanotransferase